MRWAITRKFPSNCGTFFHLATNSTKAAYGDAQKKRASLWMHSMIVLGHFTAYKMLMVGLQQKWIRGRIHAARGQEGASGNLLE